MSERTQHLDAWALGLATISHAGRVLDVRYPSPALGPPPERFAAGSTEIAPVDAQELDGVTLAQAAGEDPLRDVRRALVVTVIADLAEPPADAQDAYLRLHLLSHRLVSPGSISVDGIFAVLHNVVWSSLGPCDPDGFDAVRTRALAAGVHVGVTSVDKFPRMTDYVVPAGVRIADADRVRLGAHLAEGTTV
ncbi:MAG: 2,3,4,5-tetrahydropyridine-2,6-dicarboxylate N-succinyltransferase, partial [Actinobacteria bacterium]|nr:2,3,4,5-tetrahydropyridine-2,6-dicarboxylate N-succinyltransferase [Actinomycetota bacterium]